MLSLILLWSLAAGLPQASQAPVSVYVAEFASRNVGDAALLASFTDLFETELVNAGPYRILNRRNLNKLLAEARNERHVVSLESLPEGTRTRLAQLEGAAGVIFGEVQDDSESGEIVITATLESFDSRKHWKRSVSMKKGLLRDVSSREAAMKQLVAAILNGATDRNETAGRRFVVRQGDGIEATVRQLSLASDNQRVSLSLVLRNTSPESLYLALDNNGEIGVFAGGRVTLTDDQAKRWFIKDVVGLPVIRCCNPNLEQLREDQFVVIKPSQSLTVNVTFTADNDGVGVVRGYNAPGSLPPPRPRLFSFEATAVYHLPDGAQRISISLTDIRPRTP